jgi:hypothetical protein
VVSVWFVVENKHFPSTSTFTLSPGPTHGAAYMVKVLFTVLSNALTFTGLLSPEQITPLIAGMIDITTARPVIINLRMFYSYSN